MTKQEKNQTEPDGGLWTPTPEGGTVTPVLIGGVKYMPIQLGRLRAFANLFDIYTSTVPETEQIPEVVQNAIR